MSEETDADAVRVDFLFHGSTTKNLLIEVGSYARENMEFRQRDNILAARRARKRLSRVMKLAKLRRAEIAEGLKAMGEVIE